MQGTTHTIYTTKNKILKFYVNKKSIIKKMCAEIAKKKKKKVNEVKVIDLILITFI